MPGTRLISGRELRRLREALGDEALVAHIQEALAEGHLRPQDFSLRELAENVVDNGREWVESMNPRHNGTFGTLMEAPGAVTNNTFSRITGQIVYSMLMQGFEDESFVFSPLVKTVPTQFNGEKVPRIGGIGREVEVVEEGFPYPLVGPSETFVQTPPTKKRGQICAVTKEALFFDRTGQVLEECRNVGFGMGADKENRIIDAVIDENDGAAAISAGGHRHHWEGTSYATYQATTPWVNTVANGGLVDWTDVEAMELLLADITDPKTGEPIAILPKHLIVTPQLVHTARRIVNATEIRSGDITAGAGTQTISGNILDSYTIVSSRRLKTRLGTDTTHFLGDLSMAIWYMENWPITLSQMGTNSEDEFNRDIVAKFKVSERGAAYVGEPRLLARGTVA